MDAVRIMADEKSVISYRPRFNTHTGSVLATILLQQAAYWWCKMGEKPYYKFKEPCSAKKYKIGESWCEELGFSRREFDTARALLEDRGFLLVKTDMERLTWYSVNSEKINEMMHMVYDQCKSTNSLYVKAENAFINGGKRLLTIQETTQKNTTEDQAAPVVADTPKKPKLDQAQFDQFWNVWPKRVGKEAAMKAWAKLKMNQALFDQIIAAVNAQKQNWTDPKYIKNPATWINGKHWKDETYIPNQPAFKNDSGNVPRPASQPMCTTTDAVDLSALKMDF